MIASLVVLVIQTSRVSIPLGTYGYPEIAKRLSTPEANVTVSSSINNRGALVSMHDRTQAGAIAAICGGLDLHAVPLKSGHIKLEPNEDVERRDRRWRAGLASMLTDAWARRKAGFTELSLLDTTALEDRIAKVLSGPKPIDLDTWTDLQIVRQSGQLAMACVALINSSPSDLPVDFLSTRIQRDQTSESLSPSMTDQVQKAMAGYGGVRNPVMVQRILDRQAGKLVMVSGVFATTKEGQWVSMPSPGGRIVMGDVPGGKSPRNLVASLIRPGKERSRMTLGADAEEWLQASEKATKHELMRADMGTRFESPGYENAVSWVAEQWSAKTGSEILMELSPMAESLNIGSSALPPLQKAVVSLQDVASRDDQWGYDSIDGVLVVRNRMAFLDHVSGCPVGEIAHFARLQAGRSGAQTAHSAEFIDAGPGLPLIDDLLPLVLLRTSPEHFMATWFDFGGYRGLWDSYLQSESMLLWQGLPEEVLHQVRSKEHGKLQVQLSQCRQDCVNNLTNSILGLEPTGTSRQRLQAQIDRALVVVDWSGCSGTEARVTLAIHGIDEDLLLQNAASFRVRIGKTK